VVVVGYRIIHVCWIDLVFSRREAWVVFKLSIIKAKWFVGGICVFFTAFAIFVALSDIGMALSMGQGVEKMAPDGSPKPSKIISVDGSINAVSFSRDGSQLAVLSQFGSIASAFDTRSWTLQHRFERYSGGYSYNSVALLHDGSLLTAAPVGSDAVTRHYSNTDSQYSRLDIFSMIVWNAATGRVSRYIPSVPSINPASRDSIHTDTFALSLDGVLIAAIPSPGDCVMLYNAQTGILLATLSMPPYSDKIGDSAMSVGFSPDNTELAVGTTGGRVYFFARDGKMRRRLTAFSYPYGVNKLAYSPNGKFLAVGSYQGFDLPKPLTVGIAIIDPQNGKQISQLSAPTYAIGAIANPEPVRALGWGGRAPTLVVGYDSKLQMWDVRNPRAPKQKLNDSVDHGVGSIAFAPGGQLAVGTGNSVLIYEQ